MIKRVTDTPTLEDFDMAVNVAKFTKETVENLTLEIDDYKKKYNNLIGEYDKSQQKVAMLETEVELYKQ